MEYLEYSRLSIQPIQQWGFHHVTTAEGFNCEGGAEGPPFGGDKPNEVFALGPADSRSPCPLTCPLRLTTTETGPDPSEPNAVVSSEKLGLQVRPLELSRPMEFSPWGRLIPEVSVR